MKKILSDGVKKIVVTDEFVTFKNEDGEIKVKVGKEHETEANALMLFTQFISAYAIARDMNPIDELERTYSVIEKAKGVNIIGATILTSGLKPVE